MHVLLDVDIDVYSITISDGGRLVWSSARENKVRTNYIYIKGTMEIGSESCPFTTKTEITLKGEITSVRLWVFNHTLNNIPFILLWSVFIGGKKQRSQ
jgi:hypothetical protein